MDSVTAIVGQKGAGKSTILEIIHTHGFYTTNLSTPLRLLALEGETRTDLENNNWRDSALDIVYRNCLSKARGPVFIDGLSRPIEIDYLRKTKNKVYVVEVKANESLRYTRILERKREGERELTFDQYLERCARREGTVAGFEANDLRGLVSTANYHVENEGTLRELVKKTKKMLNHLGFIQ